MSALLLRLSVIVLLAATVGCSNYEQRWRAHAAQTFNAGAGTRPMFAGSYTGTWQSNQYKGANGSLWCILKPNGPSQLTAEFRATWHGIFASEHSINLQVTEKKRIGGKQALVFTGETEIRMWIGSGKYRCTGVLTSDSLVADYDAAYDRGRFLLRRANPTGQPVPPQ